MPRNTKFLNKIEDIRWLRETHLKGIDLPKFRSAVIWGNEDCPERIEVFFHAKPDVTDEPTAILTLRKDEGGYHRVKG